MTSDRLTHEFRAYEILVRYKDIHNHWGNWRLYRGYNTKEERDKAMADLKETNFREYKRHINEYEYGAMVAAELRRDKERKKQDDTDIAGALSLPVGIDQKDGYVSWREL